ncbi:MAG: dTMP kinase [Nitrososphaerota archaeon]
MYGRTIIVVWEGVDGAGKTTLMNETYRILESLNYRTIIYKTPSDTPTGVFARKYGNKLDIDHLTRMLLFLANTSDDSSIMKKQIEEGNPDYYFIDRYYLCSIVYGFALSKERGEEIDQRDFINMFNIIEKIGSKVFLKPDVYVIVDVPEEFRRSRLLKKESQGGLEEEIERNVGVQNSVRQFYKTFHDMRSWQVIWVENIEGVVYENAKSIVNKLVEFKKITEHL